MTWTPADGKLLKELRIAAGLDRAALARRCSLSTSQIAELEDDGTGCFYSEGIRGHTGRAVLARLGHVKAAGQDLAAPDRTTRPAPPAPVPTADTVRPRRPPIPYQDTGPAAGLPWRWISVLMAVILLAAGAWWWRGAQSPTAPDATPGGAAAPLARDGTGTAPGVAANAPAPVPDQAAPQAAAPDRTTSMTAVDACALPASAQVVAYTPELVLRLGSFVYFEASEDLPVCVVDADQRQTAVVISPAAGLNITGAPPFTVRATRWAGLRVYYQGVRVPLEDLDLQGGGLLLQPAS